MMASKSQVNPFTVEKSSVRGFRSFQCHSELYRVASRRLRLTHLMELVVAWSSLMDYGLDAFGRKQKGKGVYQFVHKYGVNVDG